MYKYALIVIVSLACLGSCREKDPPVEEIGTPVFSITGTADGTSVKLSAGEAGYYMSTGFDVQANGLYVFKGELKPTGCLSCGPSLSVYFRNYTKRFPYTIDSSLTVGRYRYFDERKSVETYYRLSCFSEAQGAGAASISWNFGNNRFSTEVNPVVSFSEPGIYPVTCTAVFPGGCFSELEQPIHLTPTRVGRITNFTVNYPDTFTLLFNSVPVNYGAKVSWDFGDGQTASGTIVQHTFAATGMYKVCMQYISGTDTAQLCRNVNTLNLVKCKSNFSFDTELITDSLHLSQVAVEWRDHNGILYSSAGVDQPVNNIFEVTGVGEYELNEKGQRTRKLSVRFSCNVSNGTQTLELKNITGTIAVAYP